jgi:GNAT superfamily N-acetyltransferase
MSLDIRVTTNRTRGFYATMGPFLSRRAIVKEVGGNIWDDDGKTWFVAFRSGKVVGFCAAADDGNKVTFKSAYVLPEHRHQGVYRALFAKRLSHYPGRHLRATCTNAALPAFTAHSFTVVRHKGSFAEVSNDAA